jgi:hypothetical protein
MHSTMFLGTNSALAENLDGVPFRGSPIKRLPRKYVLHGSLNASNANLSPAGAAERSPDFHSRAPSLDREMG